MKSPPSSSRQAINGVHSIRGYTRGVTGPQGSCLNQTEGQGKKRKNRKMMRWKQRRGNSEAGYGNRTALGIEKKGGCFLFLDPDSMREKRHHPLSLYPLISHILPRHVQQTLRTALCLYVPRIPISEKQLDTGRLTFFCLLLSAEQRRDKGWVSDRTHTCTLQRTHQSG